MLSPDLTGRLAKLIPMLSSDKDGEALNAVRAIGRTLGSAGLDFHALAKVIEGKTPRNREWDAAPYATPGFSYANVFRHAQIFGHPDELCLRFGLPLYAAERIESWMHVSRHCLKLNKQIAKKHGGRFLRDFEIRILEAIAEGRRQPTNTQAAWIETVVARCHQARDDARRAGRTDV